MPLSDRVASWIRRQSTPADHVATARVVENADPDGEGRVMIELAEDHGAGTKLWARTTTLMAGPERGTWFPPDVGDEVLVAFESGDPRRPYVLGSLWGEGAPPPEQVGVDNGRRSITTRSGARLMIDDTRGRCVVRIETARGQHLTLDDGPPSMITIDDGSGSTITLDASGIRVSSPSKATITTSVAAISASKIDLVSPIVEASGVVKCQTLMATSVVASTYTPGAGNLQ
jgi:uncharacterized protein involved in type VI secretion and phage assembly